MRALLRIRCAASAAASPSLCWRATPSLSSCSLISLRSWSRNSAASVPGNRVLSSSMRLGSTVTGSRRPKSPGLGRFGWENIKCAAREAYMPMNGAPLKVLIADDHPLILAGLRRALERSDGVEVVGEAHTFSEVMPLIERRLPDIVLLDLRMPDVTGTEHIQQVLSSWPDLKVV